MGNASHSDTHSMEWFPLKGRPHYPDHELILVSASEDVTEFVARSGHRYRRVDSEDGFRWFSLQSSGQRVNKATKAGLKICCKKFQLAFGSFVSRDPRGVVVIFPQGPGLAHRHSAQIIFCPWCGNRIQFLESEETEKPRVLTANAVPGTHKLVKTL